MIWASAAIMGNGSDMKSILAMSDREMRRQVCFEGRECTVVFAHLFAGDYFDIWLMDVETGKFTNICTVTDPDLPFAEQQRLVREEFVELLADAGIMQPTGEVFEIEQHGRLHKCDVPVRERAPFWERVHTPEQSHERDQSPVIDEPDWDIEL